MKTIVNSVVLIVLWVMVPASALGAEYDYIDIRNPYLRKLPIAIPVFAPMDNLSTEEAMADASTRLFSKYLDFTSYFQMIDPEAFLEDPSRTGITTDAIAFHNWTAVGAELLVTGGVRYDESSRLLQMELRLFDTLKGKLLVGKLYKGKAGDERRMVRRFASEVIHALTGDWGIFDSRIAFVSNGTGHKEIFISDFDGNNPRQWTRHKSITLSPAWSSDGKWLAYTSFAKGNPDLYIKHIKEKRGIVLSKKGIHTSPSWVPGQFALAATLSFSGDPEIYLLTGNAKIIKRITKKWGIDESPTWSPDGRKVAFVSNRSGSPQIYIKTIDTGQVDRLTFLGRYNTQPSWSPQGKRIAFAGMEDGQINIYVIGADGKDLFQLTRDSGDNESPSWAPDGSLITFSSTREEEVPRIYVMTAYGTDQRRLLILSGKQSSPAWSPRVVSN